MKDLSGNMPVLKVLVCESDSRGWAESSKERWEAFSPHASGFVLRREMSESAASAYTEHYARIARHTRQRGEAYTPRILHGRIGSKNCNFYHAVQLPDILNAAMSNVYYARQEGS